MDRRARLAQRDLLAHVIHARGEHEPAAGRDVPNLGDVLLMRHEVAAVRRQRDEAAAVDTDRHEEARHRGLALEAADADEQRAARLLAIRPVALGRAEHEERRVVSVRVEPRRIVTAGEPVLARLVAVALGVVGVQLELGLVPRGEFTGPLERVVDLIGEVEVLRSTTSPEGADRRRDGASGLVDVGDRLSVPRDLGHRLEIGEVRRGQRDLRRERKRRAEDRCERAFDAHTSTPSCSSQSGSSHRRRMFAKRATPPENSLLPSGRPIAVCSIAAAITALEW